MKKNKKMIKNTKGFTLIELMVVIAIIGLLSSIMLASLSSARQKAQAAKTLQQLAQIKIAFELYANDHGGQYPVVNPGEFFCIGGTDCKFDGDPVPNKLLDIKIGNITTPKALDSYGYEYKGFVYHYNGNLSLICIATCPANAATIFAPTSSNSFIVLGVGGAWNIQY